MQSAKNIEGEFWEGHIENGKNMGFRSGFKLDSITYLYVTLGK